MRFGQVIGTVTLSRAHPSFRNACLKLAVPLSLDELAGTRQPSAEPLVVWDELGADVGSQIALSEGREAAQAFSPDERPVDAYNAALLDEIVLAPAQVQKLTAETGDRAS